MGLTISYTFSTRRKLTLAQVGQIVTRLQGEARWLGFAEVGERFRVGPDYPGAIHIPEGAKKFSDTLPPLRGWLFHATPGAGSESVTTGLCQYRGVPGWRLAGFCKTQYAGQHGWEHFLKCHRAVLHLLCLAETCGLRVEVQDEGGLWETGSLEVLRRNLADYDQCVAALGGALKDAAAETGGKIESPIFNHPQFEHLEARGMAAHGGKVKQAAQLVEHLVR